MKKTLILLVLFSGLLNAQELVFEKKLTENTFTPYQNQKLILIDFWATWCAPCVPATTQLEFYQEVLQDKIYMIALSDENEEVIRKKLDRKPIKLSVCNDFKANTFLKYKVDKRPYSIIVNTKGEKVWEGIPSQLNIDKIEKLWNDQKKVKDLNSINDLITYKKIVEPEVINTIELEVKKIEPTDFSYIVDEKYFNYIGSLKEFLLLLKNKNNLQIELKEDLWINFKCDYETWKNKKQAIEDKILVEFSLNHEKKVVELKLNELVLIDKEKLWDTNQIDWGHNFPQSLIDEISFKANSFTITQVANFLSNNKKENYYYGSNENTSHDWDFIYNFDDLLLNQLEDQYGIKVVSKTKKIEVLEYYKL